MEPFSIFLAFTAAAAAVQVGAAAVLGSDDRPKPRLRVRTCWACCGTCRYQDQVCRVCRGTGLYQ